MVVLVLFLTIVVVFDVAAPDMVVVWKDRGEEESGKKKRNFIHLWPYSLVGKGAMCSIDFFRALCFIFHKGNWQVAFSDRYYLLLEAAAALKFCLRYL
jgi:hypothetical protein